MFPLLLRNSRSPTFVLNVQPEPPAFLFVRGIHTKLGEKEATRIDLRRSMLKWFLLNGCDSNFSNDIVEGMNPMLWMSPKNC
jgi:hypothetical protein